MKKLPTIFLGAALLAFRCAAAGGGGETLDSGPPAGDVRSPDGAPGQELPDDSALRDPQPILELIVPPVVPAGGPVPVVVQRSVGGQPDFWASGSYELVLSGSQPQVDQMSLYRGAGSARLLPPHPGGWAVTVSGDGLSSTQQVAVGPLLPVRELGGVLNQQQLSWGPEEIIRLNETTVVLGDQKLQIAPGTVVLLGPQVSLRVQGQLAVAGTAAAPVLVSAATPGVPWGGLRLEGGSAVISYAFFTGGGGDPSNHFGHSHSQPVIHVEKGELTLDHSFLLDNPGKGLGAVGGRLTVVNSLISRCDTGGELKYSRAEFFRTWFLEIPSADALPADDDNDGIYLHAVPDDLISGEPSATLDQCVLAVGKDDGIDHNGARVRVRDCFIEGFHHEGIACSKDNWVEVSNTLVRGCDQGIEAGYGSPTVTIDHCLLTGNRVGLRLGDSYAQKVAGTLKATNTIAVANQKDNVLNWSNLEQGPLPGHITISNSLVDSPEWDNLAGNLPGLPLFDDHYRLLPGSPGAGAGSDGLNIGLLPEG